MINYDEMSDLDLSVKILALKVVDLGFTPDIRRFKSCAGAYCRNTIELFDINNPADMWPIILKHGLIVDGNGSAISTDENGYQFIIHHANPLRAAAIVFLMMKDAE